jgi:protoporphyrinogen oxidase
VEYFCYEGDELWSKSNAEMAAFAAKELHKIGIIDEQDVLDATVIKMPKTYPAYFGAYSRFDQVRSYLDGFENLFLVGRNGMHRYNNQDHSMLTAMEAVNNIVTGRKDKSNIWAVNTEMEYHEAKQEPVQERRAA